MTVCKLPKVSEIGPAAYLSALTEPVTERPTHAMVRGLMHRTLLAALLMTGSGVAHAEEQPPTRVSVSFGVGGDGAHRNGRLGRQTDLRGIDPLRRAFPPGGRRRGCALRSGPVVSTMSTVAGVRVKLSQMSPATSARWSIVNKTVSAVRV